MLDPTRIAAIVEVQAAALLKAKELARRKPRHELLRYARDSDDETVWAQFVERFGHTKLSQSRPLSYSALSTLYAEYAFALYDACEAADGPVICHGPSVEANLDPADVCY